MINGTHNGVRPRKQLENMVILMYFAFWMFWLIYDIAAGHILKPKTYGIIFVMHFSFFAGYLLRRNRGTEKIAVFDAKLRLLKLLRIVTVVNLFVLTLCIPSILENGLMHRYLMFTNQGAFGSIAQNALNNYLLCPITFAAIITAFSVGSTDRRLRFYGYANLIVMALETLGRFPLYYIIYFYVIAFIIDRWKKRIYLTKYIKVFAVIGGVLLVAMTFLRYKMEVESFEETGRTDLYKIYMLNYHVVGYHMVDHYVTCIDGVPEMQYAYPTTSLGIVGWGLNVFTKNLGMPLFPNSYMDLMEYFNQGFYIDQLDWSYNAFTTCIVPFYADGGWLGIVVAFFAIGVICNLWDPLNIFAVNPVVLAVSFLMTFSLFMPFINVSLPLVLPPLILIRVYLTSGRRER